MLKKLLNVAKSTRLLAFERSESVETRQNSLALQGQSRLVRIGTFGTLAALYTTQHVYVSFSEDVTTTLCLFEHCTTLQKLLISPARIQIVILVYVARKSLSKRATKLRWLRCAV